LFSTEDTIVAIATPAGRGGLGVVRLSGPLAVEISQLLVGRSEAFAPRHATLARVLEPVQDQVLRAVDEVVVTWFEAPHSYTGEHVVEISGHGSPVLLERIVALAVRAGARLAEPGEFTLRAYLNGRLDLIQAEAVGDLINAVTPAQARLAMDQLDGTLTRAITRVDGVLFSLIAKCEASLDFPDEGFHFVEPDEIRDALAEVSAALTALLETAGRGRLMREGRVVVLTGRPNTGKSSLFNALLGRGRAIVTDTPGTTRDVLSERLDISGVPVTLVDTAGIRPALDPIELEGVKRAHEARESAEIALLVLDGSAALTDTDQQLLAETANVARVIAVNKCDQPPAWDLAAQGWAKDAIHTSASVPLGLDQLRERLVDELSGRMEQRDTPTVTNMRHVGLIDAARAAVQRAHDALDRGATEELLLIDLHDARAQLEEVTGRRGAEDVLRHIFATFCIGK
jgi:tRNA modification GTPase